MNPLDLPSALAPNPIAPDHNGAKGPDNLLRNVVVATAVLILLAVVAAALV
ncbi:hypothetical protein D3C83_121390 [compost metagenome]